MKKRIISLAGITAAAGLAAIFAGVLHRRNRRI